MKKQSLRIFLMFSALAILSVSYAQAQSGNPQTADIPFTFTVGDKTFPAGQYTVVRLNPASDKAALSIQSADGGGSGKIVLTTPVQSGRAREKAGLVFSHYEDRYFLSEVWTPASATGLELPKSRSERSLLARTAGQKPAARVVIALDARRR
jgi:hypothetical protein